MEKDTDTLEGKLTSQQGLAIEQRLSHIYRGNPRVEGEFIYLDPEKAELERSPQITDEDVVDFANVTSKRMAIEFVKSHSLLSVPTLRFDWHRNGPHRERWSWIIEEAQIFARCLHLFRWVGEMVERHGDDLIWFRKDANFAELPVYEADLREVQDRYGGFSRRCSNEQLITSATRFMMVAVEDGLSKYEAHPTIHSDLWAEADDAPETPGNLWGYRWAMAIDSAYPIAHLYFRLAQFLVGRTPIRECDACGKFFIVRDQRKRFCSYSCGSRVRQQRWQRRLQKSTTTRT
jgi:hypothetical protein